MSIILDALKKAEKDRSSNETEGQVPATAIVLDEKKQPDWVLLLKSRKNIFFILVAFLVIVIGIRWGIKLFDKTGSDLAKTKNSSSATSLSSPKKEFSQSSKDSGRLSAEKEKIETKKIEAMSFFEEGKLEKSLDVYKKLTEKVTDDPEIYNNLGVIYNRLGKKKEAGDAYRKALELNPDYPEVLNNLAVIDMESDNYHAAKERLLAALKLRQEYAEPYFHRASIYEREGLFKEAIDDYESFIKYSDKLEVRLKRKIELRIDIIKAKLAKEGTQ